MKGALRLTAQLRHHAGMNASCKANNAGEMYINTLKAVGTGGTEMATKQESAYAAVNAAQQVKQAAFAAYAPSGFGVFSNLATYQAAIVAADVAFTVSVNSATTTNGMTSRCGTVGANNRMAEIDKCAGKRAT